MYDSARIDDVVTTNLVVAEPVGDPDLDTDEDPGVELKEVALIGAAYNVVVIKIVLGAPAPNTNVSPRFPEFVRPANPNTDCFSRGWEFNLNGLAK